MKITKNRKKLECFGGNYFKNDFYKSSSVIAKSTKKNACLKNYHFWEIYSLLYTYQNFLEGKSNLWYEKKSGKKIKLAKEMITGSLML